MFEKIGRYEVLEELGQGSMGVVYKGRDAIIDRVVAIKTINVQKLRGNISTIDAVERFYHEARVAGRLNHTHIATIFDAGEANDTHYLIFEYVRGVTLKKLVTLKVNYTIDERLRIMLFIARALHYAHQRGVIHRDIKPANIMLLRDMQIKILDFGIAYLESHMDNVQCDKEGHIIGTPYYMSPEQIQGNETDKLTDIFSFGAMAYELLCGKRPFEANNLADMKELIVNKDPVPPNDLAEGIDNDINSIILKALNKDKSKRYQSAAEIATAIVDYLDHNQPAKGQETLITFRYDKKSLIQSLKSKYDFFADFTTDELDRLFKISSKKIYKKLEIIYKQGTPCEKIYVIIKGKVLLTKCFDDDGKDMPLVVLKSDECFGELSILDDSPHYESAKAKTDCIVIAINKAALRIFEPELCLKIYKQISAALVKKLKRGYGRIYLYRKSKNKIKEK